jgi:hypothetical protein
VFSQEKKIKSPPMYLPMYIVVVSRVFQTLVMLVVIVPNDIDIDIERKTIDQFLLSEAQP